MTVTMVERSEFRAWGWHVVLSVGLLVLVALAFGRSAGYGFVFYDDHANFVENPHYRGLTVENLRWMFTIVHLGVYQPLGWLLPALTYELLGDRPFGIHLVSLIVHSIATIAAYGLFYQLLRRIEQNEGISSSVLLMLGAAAAAAFFAVHPLRTECVAWASGQPYLTAALFSLLTLVVYLHRPVSGAWRWRLLGLLFYAMALLCKAIPVPLPAWLVLIDIAVLRRLPPSPEGWFSRGTWPVWREKVPYLLLSIACGLVAVAGGTFDTRTPDLALGSTLLLSLYVICFHAWKTLAPLELGVVYDLLPSFTPWRLDILTGATVAVLVTLACVALRRRAPILLVIWVAYLAMLSPHLHLIHHGPQITADRYSYLACLPFALLFGFAGMWVYRRGHGRIAVMVPVLVIAALTWLSHLQTLIWRDTPTFWTYNHMIAPDSPTALFGLAAVRTVEGRLEEALKLHRRAVERQPLDVTGGFSFADLLLKVGRLDEAERHARVIVDSGAAPGLGEMVLGQVLLAKGQRDAGVNLLEQAAAVTQEAGRFTYLGVAFDKAGLAKRALAMFEQAARLAPWDPLARRNLGAALMREGRYVEAATVFEELAVTQGTDLTHSYYAAVCWLKAERFGEAKAAFERVLSTDPGNIRALVGYSWLRSSSADPLWRDPDEALKLAKRAYANAPGEPRVLDCLAGAMARSGDFAGAQAQAAEARRLAVERGRTALAESIGQRLARYSASQPLEAVPDFDLPPDAVSRI